MFFLEGACLVLKCIKLCETQNCKPKLWSRADRLTLLQVTYSLPRQTIHANGKQQGPEPCTPAKADHLQAVRGSLGGFHLWSAAKTSTSVWRSVLSYS
jgi:hypothetical protein